MSWATHVVGNKGVDQIVVLQVATILKNCERGKQHVLLVARPNVLTDMPGTARPSPFRPVDLQRLLRTCSVLGEGLGMARSGHTPNLCKGETSGPSLGVSNIAL